MYTRSASPIIWFDVNRVSLKAADLLMRTRPQGTVIPVLGSHPPPIGIIGEPYPTPDQLWRWTPPTP